MRHARRTSQHKQMRHAGRTSQHKRMIMLGNRYIIRGIGSRKLRIVRCRMHKVGLFRHLTQYYRNSRSLATWHRQTCAHHETDSSDERSMNTYSRIYHHHHHHQHHHHGCRSPRGAGRLAHDHHPRRRHRRRVVAVVVVAVVIVGIK